MNRSIYVTDTNIWIDLRDGYVIAEVFDLPYRFSCPDLAKDELKDPDWKALQKYGLRFSTLSSALMLELMTLKVEYPGLSVTDIGAFILARKEAAILLTGDGKLRKVADERGLAVHGTLWLLDEMYRLEVLDARRAANALDEMLKSGSRFPDDECQSRFSRWRSS